MIYTKNKNDMKHLHTFESFLNEAYRNIPGNMKISGKFSITVGNDSFETLIAGFERDGDDTDSLYLMDEDEARVKYGSFIVKNSDMPKLSKGQEVMGITTIGNKQAKLKRIEDLNESLSEAKEFDVNDLPKGAIITFKDGETWMVTKVIGNTSNPRGYMLEPYGKTKEHYISMQIEFSLKKLEDDIESVA